MCVTTTTITCGIVTSCIILFGEDGAIIVDNYRIVINICTCATSNSEMANTKTSDT